MKIARPISRPSTLSKVNDVARQLIGVRNHLIEPRKGQQNAGVRVRSDKTLMGDGRPLAKTGVVNYGTIYDLADNDDIVFSIRRTIKAGVTEVPWKISPDLDGIKSDLKRWRQIVEINISAPGLQIKFEPQHIDPSFFLQASGALRELLQRVGKEEQHDPSKIHTNSDLRQFFDNVLKYHQAIAEAHIQVVKQFLDKPNPSAESSFPAFLNLVLDDLMLYDAAAIIKNPTESGALGEIYTLPGQNIRVYRSLDYSTPQAPHIAYDWYEDDRIRAVYNNLELVYLAANMRRNGYGKPPLESILKLMVAALYGDNYIIEQFTNNNMPAGLFDLGDGIDIGEIDAYQKKWDQKVAKGLRRIMFVANPEGVKGFIPIPQPSNKDQDINELFKRWAARKCAVFGLSLNDIGFTEDLHRTTAETQQEMTQSRGIKAFADLIAGYINQEIVRGELWLRDEPDNLNCLEGTALSCFPFRDVKFEFVEEASDDKKEQADRDAQLVRSGVLSINEVREERGKHPIEGGDEHVIFDGSTPMRVADLTNLPTPTPEQVQQDLAGAGKTKPGGQGGAGGGQPALPGGTQDGGAAAAKSVTQLGETLAKAIRSASEE